MKADNHKTETRDRILGAAQRLFAERGFRATTVAMICKAAEANIAAVNYHFGSKEELYVAAWRISHRDSLERHPQLGGVRANASADKRLCGWIRGLLRRILDPECYDFEITHMERASPTEILKEPMRETIVAMEDGLAAIIHEFLGKGATREEVQMCVMSIHSQCLNPLVIGKRHVASGKEPHQPGPPPLFAELEAIEDHVIRFSLGGLNSVRNQIKTRERGKK